jgi:hypothetical protein
MNARFGRWVQIGPVAVAFALLGSAPVASAQEPRVIAIAAKRFAFSPSASPAGT